MHTEFTQLMSLALDDEASPDEVRRLRSHLSVCPACASLWAQWQAVDRRLAAAPSVAPPVSLVSRVSQSIAERELRRRRTRWVGSGLFLVWLLVFALGLTVIFGVADWFVGHPQQIAAILSALAHFLSVATWLLREFVAFLADLGAPRVAAGVGLFVTLTCTLAVIWLWIMGRSQRWLRSPLLAGR